YRAAHRRLHDRMSDAQQFEEIRTWPHEPLLCLDWSLAAGEGHVGSERSGLDDDIVDPPAVAENAVELAQVPIDRGAAVETDVEHQAAGDVADRPQHTLVGGTVPEARDDLEIAVADQRRDHAAVHRLSVRQESAAALGRRPLMWRQFQEFLRRCAIVEWIDHV